MPNKNLKDSKETINKILELRKNNPCATLSFIAKQVNTSHQYVDYILSKHGAPTKHYKQEYICNNCGIKFKPTQAHKSRLYCSNECKNEHQHKLHWITVKCAYCKGTKEVRVSQYNRQLKCSNRDINFCSKKCQGKWLSDNYGFKNRHPKYEHEGRPKKYDYELVWQKHLETGFGCVKLSRILNISEPTISRILRLKRNELESENHE